MDRYIRMVKKTKRIKRTFKQKLRRKSRRKYLYQKGGVDCLDSVIKKIKETFGKITEVKDKTMTIYMRELIPEKRLNICHHYSLFSLIGDGVPTPPGSDGISNELFREGESPYDMTLYLGNYGNDNNLQKKLFKVRLYKFSPGNNDAGYIVHTSRFENGHWWHKFNNIDCLVSFNETQFENFGDTVIREIDILAYDVPNSMFEDGSGTTIKESHYKI